MNVVTATVTKLVTDDNIFGFNPDVEIGKEYQVDLDTIGVHGGISISDSIEWEKEMIQTADEDAQWIPTELLNIPEPA